MTRVIHQKLIPCMVLGLCSGGAWAAGFQLLEQNASGLGNAYAGSAAVADNASTIFFNPAGMTQLQPREVSVGLTAVGTSFKFSDAGSSVGLLGGAGHGGDSGGWGFVPNGYVSWAVNQNLYIGVGFGGTFAQFEAVAHKIGQILNFGLLVIMRQNDRIAFLFQPVDFGKQV